MNHSIPGEQIQNDPPSLPVALPQQQQQQQEHQQQQELETEKTYDTWFVYETSTQHHTEISNYDTDQLTSDALAITESSAIQESSDPGLEEEKLTTAENVLTLKLDSEMNGSKLKDDGKIKDPKVNSPFRWFKFFG